MDLGRGAAATRGRVGFVRNEDRVGRDLLSRNATVGFGLRHQVLHHLADVLNIEASAVEGAVRRDRAQHFADGLDSAFARGLGALDDKACGAHAHDQAVPATVKGSGGFFHYFVSGGRAAGQEARAKPFDGMIGGDVVGRDHDHATAASGTDPVFGQRDCLRGAGAGGVDLRVGTARADEFGKLRMSHRQGSEQEAAVEDVGLLLDGVAQVFGAPFDFLFENGVAVRFGASREQILQQAQLLAAGVIGVIATHFIGEGIAAGERGSEDHASTVAQRVGQGPAILQLRISCRGLVAHDQRDAGIAQGVEAHRDGELGRTIKRGHGGRRKCRIPFPDRMRRRGPPA